jgi:hypothetical protein
LKQNGYNVKLKIYTGSQEMIPEDYWASCIFVASDTPFSLNASMVK